MPKLLISDASRLRSKTVFDPRSFCWNWQARIDRHGYGYFKMRGKSWLAHRASYTLFKCDIPAEMPIDHLCRNTRCVNPAHLEVVTHKENRVRQAAAQTHCVRGHEFSMPNTVMVRGARVCRACNRIRAQSSRARRKQS